MVSTRQWIFIFGLTILGMIMTPPGSVAGAIGMFIGVFGVLTLATVGHNRVDWS